MEYSFYDFLKLIGSLGLFLYGMKIMSEGLQKVAGDRLRGILTAMTTNRVTGVLTGVLITALIQSSSATTVMVVSFVNAGLLTLAESISVIMGGKYRYHSHRMDYFGFRIQGRHGSFCPSAVGHRPPAYFFRKKQPQVYRRICLRLLIPFHGSFVSEDKRARPER